MSVRRFVTHFSQDLSGFNLNFLHKDILPYILKSDSWILENCICCLDNWVNETNLDQKRNILHFNKDKITFCSLNDAP